MEACSGADVSLYISRNIKTQHNPLLSLFTAVLEVAAHIRIILSATEIPPILRDGTAAAV